MGSNKKLITPVLIAIFLVLGGITFWYLNQDPAKDKTTLIKEEMAFAQDVEQVHKIFLAQRDGTTTTLTRKDGYWLVNDTYKANPNVMKNLLETLKGVRVDYVPTKAAVPHIVKSLATLGIKVELYDAGDNLLKTYYVGGMTNDERGTYMIMDGKENPYVTHLPQLDGGLRWRYALRGEQWRDKTIIEYQPEEIQYISMEYPKNKNLSYVLSQRADGFSVRPFYETTPVIAKEPNENLIQSHLLNFEKIIAEGFENKNPQKDSIRNLVPFSILTIETSGGEKTTYRFYPIDADRVDPVTGQPIMVERYFADVNGEDFMLVQQQLVGKLFRRYDSFFD